MLRLLFMLLLLGLSFEGQSQDPQQEHHQAILAQARRDKKQAIDAYRRAQKGFENQQKWKEAFEISFERAQCLLEFSAFKELESLLTFWKEQTAQQASYRQRLDFYALVLKYRMARKLNNQAEQKQKELELRNFLSEFRPRNKAEELEAAHLYSYYAILGLGSTFSEQQKQYAQQALEWLQAQGQTQNLDYGRLLLHQNQLIFQQIDNSPKTIRKMNDLARSMENLGLSLGIPGLELRRTARGNQYLIGYILQDTIKCIKAVEELERFALKEYGPKNPILALTYINTGALYKDVWASLYNFKKPQILPSARKAKAYSLQGIAMIQSLSDWEEDLVLRAHLSTAYRNLGFLGMEQLGEEIPFDSITYYCDQAYRYAMHPNSPVLPQDSFPDFSLPAMQTVNTMAANMALGALARSIMAQYEKDPQSGQADKIIKICNSQLSLLSKEISLNRDEKQAIQLEGQRNKLYEVLTYVYHKRFLHEKNMAYLDPLIRYIEQKTASRTRRKLNTAERLRQAQVPTEKAQAYLQLGQNIQQLRLQFETAQREKQSGLADALRKELLELNNQATNFENELKTNYPLYNKLLFELPVPSLREIQQRLRPNTACMLGFNDHERDLAVLVITQDTAFSFHASFYKNYDEKINSILKLLKPTDFEDPKLFTENQAAFVVLAREFFKEIFPHHTWMKSRGIDHLILSSSGNFGVLPFEVLLCSEPASGASYKQMDFLLRHYSIQYVPSIAFWQEAGSLAKQSNTNGKILGYAPVYGGDALQNAQRPNAKKAMREALQPLSGAKNELDFLREHYYGDFTWAAEANEQQFKQAIKQPYSIVHLAMHGILDSNDPSQSALVFSETLDSLEDNFLEAVEIGRLSIPAQLIFLSACETGAAGVSLEGEGSMSLARYFLYAGSPALIATRWELNDQTTADIVQGFYQELYKGQTVHKALQIAQLKYLDNAEGIGQHPFFWAAFQNIGYTDRSITLASKNWFWSYLFFGLLALCIALGIGGYAWRKRNKVKV